MNSRTARGSRTSARRPRPRPSRRPAGRRASPACRRRSRTAIARTRWPSAGSRSTRCDPMNPSAPVTAATSGMAPPIGIAAVCHPTTWLSFPRMTHERPAPVPDLRPSCRPSRGAACSASGRVDAPAAIARPGALPDERAARDGAAARTARGDPLRFPGAWIYAWCVARAAARIARSVPGEVILVPQDALATEPGAVPAGRRRSS